MSLLGIDIGTGGCKAAVFSESGSLISSSYRTYPTIRRESGYAEFDSSLIWKMVKETIRDVAAKSKKDRIRALSVSSLGEAVVPVSKNRKILGNSILCSDIRGAEYIDRLRKSPGQKKFYSINPNILGTNYSLPKILWIRDNDPELFKKTDYFLLWADAVCFLLGADPVTSNSLANRTLLFDMGKQDWSKKLLDMAELPAAKFAKIVPGGTKIGKVSDRIASELALPEGVDIVAGAHDQCCNSLGCGNISAGSAICGIGSYECITPAFSRMPPSSEMLRLGLNAENHLVPGLYVSFIYNQAGTLAKWFAETFASAELKKYGSEKIFSVLETEIPEEPTKLLVLPYFETTGSPGFISDASGAILGLKTDTSRGEILKSIMECVTLYFVESIEGIRGLGIDTNEFIATGGGSRSDKWLQIKADIFGVPFARPRITEGSVLGAAMNAGISSGVFKTPAEAVSLFVKRERIFDPDMRRHKVYREKLNQYQKMFPLLYDLLKDMRKVLPSPGR